MGYPINTTDDDIFYCPVKKGVYAYQSKFVKGGQGDLDIIRIEIFSSLNPMKYTVKGNLGSLLPDLNNLLIFAVNSTHTSDSIKVTFDKNTKDFNFKGIAGTYELIFKGKNVRKSKTFVIPDNQKVQEIVITPEIALVTKESLDFLTYVESDYKYTFAALQIFKN